MIRSAIALAALLAWAGCLGLILLAHRLRFGLDETSGESQKKHRVPTPRSGGMAVVAAFGVGAAMVVADGYAPGHLGLGLALAGLPLLAAAVIEDLRRHVPPRLRAAAGLASAVLAVLLCGAAIQRLDLPGVDAALAHWPLLGAALAVVAIAALPHAVNMIDGFHGLASFVGAMILAAIGYVAFKVGDTAVLGLAGVAVGALVGFLFWNWPRGQIFLGDTGAYFIGFVAAVLAVLLVRRHPQVSPWFALLVLIYPTWELLFSVWRRRVGGARSGMEADSLHLHHLVYRRLSHALHLDGARSHHTSLNAYTAPYLWSLAAFSIVPATLWWDRTPLLAAGCAVFVVAYVTAYRVLYGGRARRR